MNEANLETRIKEYITKLKDKLNVIEEYNDQLENLKLKKEELLKQKKKLIEINNKKTFNEINTIIQSSLNEQDNCSYDNLSLLNDKNIWINEIKTIEMKNNEMKEKIKKYNIELNNIINKIKQSKKECHSIILNTIKKSDFKKINEPSQ